MNENNNWKYTNESFYRGGTLNAIDILACEDMPVDELLERIIETERKCQRVHITDDSNVMDRLVDAHKRSNEIILLPMTEGMSKAQLAQYYNISPQHLSMLIGEKYCNTVNRDLILISLLSPRDLIRGDDVNHILMEVGHPGLFDETTDRQANMRNRIIYTLFDYAQDHECPRDTWLTFARDILADKSLEMLYRQEEDQVGFGQKLSNTERALVEQWLNPEDRELGSGNYMVFRKQCFDRYCAAGQLRVSGAHEKLGNDVFIGKDSVKALLSSKHVTRKNRGSRETLVRIAIELGCTLNEANRLLMEASYPLLYPLRKEETEREWIRQLLHNHPEPL